MNNFGPVCLPADEHILCTSWEMLAKEAGLEYQPTEHAREFFDEGKHAQLDLTGHFWELPDTVLVSGYSDYGVHKQEGAHPNADLVKNAQVLPWGEIASLRDQYRTVAIGPTCKEESCKITDKYSIKIDRYTLATFNEVPSFIKKWYLPNLNIHHEKCQWIPFGLNNDGPGWTYMSKHFGKPKTGLLYVNFQNHTMERAMLKQHFAQVPWVTTHSQANLPVQEFLHQIASHKFVLCPFGNGLDCFRVYESIYLGSIPVLLDCVFSRYLLDAGLPVLVVDNFLALTPETLEASWQQACNMQFDYRAVSLSFWRGVFNGEKK